MRLVVRCTDVAGGALTADRAQGGGASRSGSPRPPAAAALIFSPSPPSAPSESYIPVSVLTVRRSSLFSESRAPAWQRVSAARRRHPTDRPPLRVQNAAGTHASLATCCFFKVLFPVYLGASVTLCAFAAVVRKMDPIAIGDKVSNVAERVVTTVRVSRWKVASSYALVQRCEPPTPAVCPHSDVDH